MSRRASPVPLAPEARHGEGQERQRSPLALDRGQHLVGQALLEAVALRARGLDERAPERVAGGGGQRHQAVEDRPEALVVVAAHQEVVAHREDDAHVGLGREAAEEGREARLALRRVEREQLLELVHDHDGRDVPAPPAGEEGEGRTPGRRIGPAAGAPRGRPRGAARGTGRAAGGAPCPGCTTITAQPVGCAAATPARTKDVLPAPDGPMTPSSRSCRSRSQTRPTSASRPKKRPVSASVNARRPG